MSNVCETNQVYLLGEVESEPTYSHSMYNDGIYQIMLKVNRLSDNYDLIPVMVSERLLDLNSLKIGTKIAVTGKFNSFNRHNEETQKATLILYVFAKDVEVITEDKYDSNSIYLKGFVCKEPHYRKTPLGREITDLFVAVNRPYGKSDYIPCVVWGRNARYASNLNVGEPVVIEGRVQSRVYSKRVGENETVEKTAYEVSVSKITSNPETESDSEN